MLRVKVHGSKEAPEKKLHMKLMEDPDGVVVCAVDDKGEVLKGGSIVRIGNDGVLVRVPHISKDMGVKMNKKGQILEKVLK